MHIAFYTMHPYKGWYVWIYYVDNKADREDDIHFSFKSLPWKIFAILGIPDVIIRRGALNPFIDPRFW